MDQPSQNLVPIINQNVKDDKKDTPPSSTDDSESRISSMKNALNDICNFCKANYEENPHNLEWLWKCGYKVCKKCVKVSELLII